MWTTSRKMIALVFALVLFSFTGGAPASARILSAPYRAESVSLNPDGQAYEVNLDHNGRIWVSDCDAGEIRMINPHRNESNRITFVNQADICPSDARRDRANNVWFVDGNSISDGRIGRLEGSDWSQVTYWTVSSAGTTYYMVGTAIDNSGNLWISDWISPSLYRFNYNPGSGEETFTEYPFPDVNANTEAGPSNYVLAMGDNDIWVADSETNDILCLHPADSSFERWDLPDGVNDEGPANTGQPNKLAADIYGNIWWVDSTYGVLGRLIAGNNRVTLYPLPDYSMPQGIAVLSTEIWYTEQFAPAVGMLNPLHPDADETHTFTVGYQGNISVTPIVLPASAITQTGGQADIGATSSIPWEAEPMYAGVALPNESWESWKLPCSEPDPTPCDSVPYGIVDAGNWAYFVDQGRQRLVRITTKLEAHYLPLVERY